MSAKVFSTRNQQIISLICLCLFDKILTEKIAKFRLSSLDGGFLAVLLWVLFSFLQLMWMAGVHWWRKNTQEELDMQASGKIGQATTASQAPNTQNRMRKHRLSHSSCWPLHTLMPRGVCVWHHSVYGTLWHSGGMWCIIAIFFCWFGTPIILWDIPILD